MSGIITLVIALILLVAAVYNLISYIRDRRSASLPSKNQALKVIKAVFSLPRRDWPAHLFALLRDVVIQRYLYNKIRNGLNIQNKA